MNNAQSIWRLRNQVKDLKEARARQAKILEQKDAQILELMREVERLKREVNLGR